MRKLAMFFFLGVVLALNVSASFAQENTDDKFSFGKVVSVSAQELKVKEYDFAKDADVEMVYNITSETELGNLNAVTDLVANDDVVIDYAEKDGKRVVMTLVKEDKGAEATAEVPAATTEPVPAAAASTETVVKSEAPAAPVQQ